MIKHIIFTDGGCSGNPGVGAWAFNVYNSTDYVYGTAGGLIETTNNIMELTAVINALIYYKNNFMIKDDEVAVFTDSEYVQKGISDWISLWKKNNWTKSDGKTVKNINLWQKLDELNSEIKIYWYHVKGHSGISENEKCDSMVQNEIKKLSNYEKNVLF